MNLCMLVVSTGEGLQETKVPPAVNRVTGIQRSSANGSSEDLHDSHGLQSSACNDRSFHEICRVIPLHDSIGERNVRSLDKCVDSKALLPHHIPIGQWQSVRG